MDNGKRPLGGDRQDRKFSFAESEPGQRLPQPNPHFQPAEPKTSRKKSTVILSILLILALIGAGVMAYLWFNADKLKNDAESTAAEQKTEIADLRNQISANEEPVDNPDAPVASSDEEQIIEAATRYQLAATDENEMVIPEIKKIVDDYASVSYGEQAGVLKKVDEVWTVLHTGNEIPSDVIERFSIPQEVLQWDEAPATEPVQ